MRKGYFQRHLIPIQWTDEIFLTWQVILIASYQGESDGPRPITSSSSLGLTCTEITRDINGHNKTILNNANEGQSQRLPDTSLPFILQTVAMPNQKATPRKFVPPQLVCCPSLPSSPSSFPPPRPSQSRRRAAQSLHLPPPPPAALPPSSRHVSSGRSSRIPRKLRYFKNETRYKN